MKRYSKGLMDCLLGLSFLILTFSLFWGCGKSAYLYYEEAEKYANKGDYKTAIEEYKKAIDEFPENITFRKNLAYLYYQTEDYQSCISELKKISKIESDNAQVISDLRHVQIKIAQDYEENDKPDKAVAVYEELLKNEPENSVILKKLINLNRKLGNESKLIAYLEKVPPDSDMYSAALSQTTAINIKNRNYLKAIENVKKLIKLKPDNINMRYVLVSLYRKTKQYGLAIEQLWEINRNLPELQRAEVQKEIKDGYLSQAAAFEMKNKLKQAAKAYEKALKFDLDDNMLHHKLGNLYYQMEQYARAKRHFQKASDLYGINNVAYLHYMHSRPQGATLQGMFQEIEMSNADALKEFKEFLRECAKRYNIELSLIVALIKAESSLRPDSVSRTGNVGLMQLGVAAAEDIGLRVDDVVDERYDPKKNIIAGVRYLSMMIDRYDGVITEALSAYNAGPNSVKSGTIPNYNETRGLVAKVVHQMERYEKYPDELERDINILATNVIEYQDNRTEMVLDSRVKEAIDMLEKAKSNPIALFNLALLYDEIEQNSQACELYQQLLESPFVTDLSLQQITSTARLNLAYNKLMDGEYESAYSLLKDVEIDKPQYRYEAGLVFAALRKFDKSLEYLTGEFGSLTPEQRVSVYNTLGYVYLKSGKLSNARENFEKALKIEPEDLFASQGIAFTELIANAPGLTDKHSLLTSIVYNLD